MSKELTPLEAAKELKDEVVANYYQDQNWFDERYEIIEKALKEKELQDVVIKVLKEVVAFGKVLPRIEPNKEDGFDILSAVGIKIQRDIENEERKQLRDWILKTCFPKELKALEIIKEKGICMFLLEHSKNADDYNDSIDNFRGCDSYLEQEEFKLLKEELSCD